MSSRTVAVVLKAQVDDYVNQMSRARQHTTEVEKAARSATEQFRVHNEALTKVGVGMAAVGAAAAVGIGLAVKAAAEYGSKMAQLQSLSHAGATDMQRLSDAAMKQGTAFGYSATQVAEAEIELSKAGRSAADMLGGDLKGALVLAAAGQMDVAKATEIGVTALTQFSATGATIPQVADALAAGADKALGSVEDLGMALNQGGLVAAQMGLNLDDTVGTLSAFAQAGLKGSDAGTSLKNMFLMLQSPTKQSKDLLEQYNITAYDTQGKFVGVANLAGQLQRAFKGKSDAERDAALSTIFGSDAIRGANVLYKNGQDGIRGWTEAVHETGFASAQAAGKMNSLQGDAQKLAAAFQTDLIKAGSSTDGMFRGLVQSATGLVGTFGSLPQPVMAVGVGMTAVVAATGLVGGTALITIPKVIALRGTLDELGISGRKAAGFIGKGSALLIGVGLLAAGLAATAQHGVADAQQISLAGETVTKGWKGVEDLFKGGGFGNSLGSGLKKALAAEQFQAGSAKILDTWSGGLSHFSDVYKTSEGQFDALGQQLAGLAQQDYGRAASSFSDLVKKYNLSADETTRLLGLMPGYREELIKQAQAAGVSATDHNLLLIAQGKGAVSAKVLAAQQAAAAKSSAEQQAGIQQLAGTAVDATHDVNKLADAISGFGSTTLDARSAQRDFEQAVDDAREAAKKGGNVLKDSTKADRDKQDALDGVAKAALASAAAFAKQPGGVKKAQAALEDGRKAFVEIATEMTGSSKKANKLADDLGLIPDNVRTAYGLSGVDGALNDLATIQKALDRIHNKSVTVTVNQDGSTGTAFSDSRESAPHRAAGGAIDGPGQKGVDSVYAMLAPGEHVLTAQEVDRMGGQGAVSAFRADLMHFAQGGAVDAITSARRSAGSHQYRADDLQEELAAQKKRAARAQKAADKAQDHYESIGSGKKDKARKKAAKAAADRAKKSADAASAKADDLRTARDAEIKLRDDRKATVADLRNDSEDFVSSERRGGQDPLGYVDQLRAMSRDENYSPAKRKQFDQEANAAEKSITAQMKKQTSFTDAVAASTKKLDAQKDTLDKNRQAVDDATSALDQIKSTATQFASSIAGSISGKFQATSAVTAATKAGEDRQVASGWITRNGIRMQNTTIVKGAEATEGGKTTVGTLSSYYSSAKKGTAAFAAQLKRLAAKHLDPGFLAEIAQDGPEDGGAIATALLSATNGQFASINADYRQTQSNAGAAGSVVSQYTYGGQIAAAQKGVDAAKATYAVQAAVVASQTALVASQQKSADQIGAALKGEGGKLRDVIGKAFGVKGYATGTIAATEGLHWVGESGPELVGLRAGQAVGTAADSARWVRGGGSSPGAGAGGEQRIVVEFPQEIAFRDSDGAFVGMVRTEARGVASQVVTERHEDLAVRLMGGSQ